jgi:hypothetical protein
MIYPSDLAINLPPIAQPTELVCFIKLPDGRIQDLGRLCGEKPIKPRQSELRVNSNDDSPAYLPPNAGNTRPDSEQPAQSLPEEEEE